MAPPIKGDVVVVPFPFADRSGTKRRPALVVATLPGRDAILCEITSHPPRTGEDVVLELSDFSQGTLSLTSTIRPTHLFTIDETRIIRQAGRVTSAKLAEVTTALVRILTR